MKPSRVASSKPRVPRGKTKPKSATRSARRKTGVTSGRSKPSKSALKKSGKTAASSARTQSTRSGNHTSAKSKRQAKSPSRRIMSTAKRASKTPAQRRRQDPPTPAPAQHIGRKALPRLGRPGIRPTPSESTPPHVTTALPETPVAIPVDPLIVESRLRTQRMEARAPMMPHGPAAPKPLPPRSGKPLWRRPQSS